MGQNWHEGYMVRISMASETGFEIIPYEQCHGQSAIKPVASDTYSNRLEELNRIIADDKRLKEEVERYYQKSKFMYKSNDYMAEQYYTAVVAFSQMADLNEEKIHIVANGAGARVALQTATKHFFKPRDLTLISTEMNLRAKLDFDVINFVREKDVSFMKALNLKNPGENIHLITSSLNSSSGIKENTLLKEMLERKGSGKGADNKVVLSNVSLANPINEISNGSVIRSTVEYIAKRDGTTYEGNSSLFFLQMITALLHVLLFVIVVYA